MRLIIGKDENEVSRQSAWIVAEAIRRKPHFVLGLDVSNTMVGSYRELARLHREAALDFSRIVTFNVDEYLGLDPTHEHSCRSFMEKNLFGHINMDRRNINMPNGLTGDPQTLCREYEKAIREVAGIDLQLLGIGRDGRIGFNEPGSSLASRTRIKTLTEETRRAKAGVFGDIEAVPRFAITMGVGTIMEARTCVLLACGRGKAEILVKAVEGPITATVPASMLQLHGNVTVIVDEEAAADLRQKDYYRYVEKMTQELQSAQI